MAKSCSLDCASFEASSVWVSSGTGDSAGDSEAGLTVGLTVELMSSSTRLAVSFKGLWPSWELNSSGDRDRGASRSGFKGDDDRVTTPVSRLNCFSSSSNAKLANFAVVSIASSSLLRCSNASTSRRFRSREDWAARRFRRTRSTRRCSFSSSVLARFLLQHVRFCVRSDSLLFYLTSGEGLSWALGELGPMISSSLSASSLMMQGCLRARGWLRSLP